MPSDPGPPVAIPNWAEIGGSGELGCSGNGSVMHGETHFLLNFIEYIIIKNLKKGIKVYLSS
jgi:hypothetical protein